MICPICKRPLRVPGRVVSAKTTDSQHIVFSICAACTRAESTLPKITQVKRLHRAAVVAMADPARYGVEAFDGRMNANMAALLIADLAGHHKRGVA